MSFSTSTICILITTILPGYIVCFIRGKGIPLQPTSSENSKILEWISWSLLIKFISRLLPCFFMLSLYYQALIYFVIAIGIGFFYNNRIRYKLKKGGDDVSLASAWDLLVYQCIHGRVKVSVKDSEKVIEGFLDSISYSDSSICGILVKSTDNSSLYYIDYSNIKLLEVIKSEKQ